MLNCWPARNQRQSFAELETLLRWKLSGNSLCHILYAEPHLLFLSLWRSVPKNLLVTIHQPPSWWDEASCHSFKPVKSAIILYQRDLDFFEQLVGRGRVHFIHHGVDTDFFTPSDQSPSKRILYSGVHLRNTAMLIRLINSLHQRRPDLRFDLLVPEHRRSEGGLLELKSHPAVTWHAGLDDRQLLNLYRRSRMLLLPMNDSGANTAVVESLACGLPVITTDVGGIRDYGGREIYPLLENNDDRAMLELVEACLDDDSLRAEMSSSARRFAERTLAWSRVAARHMEVYTELSG
mgnify:CR=1 FL=1